MTPVRIFTYGVASFVVGVAAGFSRIESPSWEPLFWVAGIVLVIAHVGIAVKAEKRHP